MGNQLAMNDFADDMFGQIEQIFVGRQFVRGGGHNGILPRDFDQR